MVSPTVWDLVSFENEVFRVYCFWSCLLVIKMLLMGPLTGVQRFRTKTYANPEDAGENDVKFGNESVERVRRAHRNDMENILPFFLVGFLFVLTDPDVIVASWLYRVAGAARIIHTLVYSVYVVRQPSRALAFMTMLLISIYMAVRVMIIMF